jgi:Fic family protein
MEIELPVSPETLRIVTRLDHFRGAWAGGASIPPDRLDRLREAARIQSVAASCQIAGIRVTEAEVAALLLGEAVPFKDGREVLGYATALEAPFPAHGPLVTTEEIRALHALAMGVPGDPPEPTGWRTEPYHLEVFDTEGRAVGRVFQTLPPRLIDETMEELTTWLEVELRRRKIHPLLVIGAFVLHFVSTCPFPRGNGRMANLLTVHLTRRAGYDYLPCASLERILLEMRDGYFDALDAAETRLWTGEANLEPWLDFHLQALDKHCDRVESLLEVERRSLEFSPLQRKILDTVREHGVVGAGILMQATGVNRNTLKDNLRRMVDRGVLERQGERRGARYRLPSADSGAAGVAAHARGPAAEK